MMFESAEQKAEVLALLDRARKAIEDESPSQIELLMLDVMSVMFRMIAKDIPGALPMVILEDKL